MREKLKQKIYEFAEQMYMAGYIDGYNEASSCTNDYQRGLNDAWECARKIVGDDGLGYEELYNIFGYRSNSTIFNLCTASEAIAKIKEYEEKNTEEQDKNDFGCFTVGCEEGHKKYKENQKQTEEWDSETMCGQFYEDDEGIKAQIQTNDELCSCFECACNFKGECKNVKKCDAFKPITENETSEQQIGNNCMNCKYHVTDYSNPNFPCFLIRRGHSCTNFSAWESNVTEKLYSNEEKQADDEIKVGDEVIFSQEWYKTKAVITNINRESNTVVCVCADGDDCVFVSPSNLIKTGRHFPQITEVLKQMKEG